MIQRNRSMTAFAASLMLAGGVCMAQAQQPAVRDTLPPGQGAAADKAGASDRATGTDRAQPAAAQQAGMKPMAMGEGKQIDQQIEQQLQKIMQSKEMAGEKLFVLNTAVGNMCEIAYAQQAMQKSQDQQVKQVAQMILQDHSQAGQQLMQVAQKLQLELPQGLPSMKQTELQIKGQMESEMYNKKYLAHNDAVHAKDVTMFKHVSMMAQQPDVKQFAAQTLPKLQQHHQMIKQAMGAMGMSAGTDAQPAGSRIEGTSPRSGASDTGTSGTSSGGSSPRNTGNSNQPGLDDPQRSGSNPKVPGQGTTTPPNQQ